MARYTYNKAQVNEALDSLKDSGAAIVDTNNDIQSGINMICNARGALNLDLDETFMYIKNLNTQVKDSITAISTEISNKAREIEEYENAPWYKKIFATIGMSALKLAEGLVSLVENISDGVVAILGFVPGLIFPSFQDALSEYIKTDHVGDFFSEQYENGLLTSVNKYSAMSHESTAANVLKGVGVVTGYVIIGVATGGMGTAAMIGTTAGLTFAGGVGSGTQEGLQEGKEFNDAFFEGVKEGAVSAAITAATAGIASKFSSMASTKLLGAGDDAVKALAAGTDDTVNVIDDAARLLTAGDDVANAADDVARAAAKNIGKSSDDIVEVFGKHTGKDGRTWLQVKRANGADDLIEATTGKAMYGKDVSKEAFKAANYTDEAAKTAAKSLGLTDEVANAADDAVNAASGVKGKVNAVKDTIKNSKPVQKATEFAGKVKSTKPVQKATEFAGKVKTAVSNTASKVANSKPVQAVSKATDNVIRRAATTQVGQKVGQAMAAHPHITNGIIATTGPIVTGAMSFETPPSDYISPADQLNNYQQTPPNPTHTPDPTPEVNTVTNPLDDTTDKGTGSENGTSTGGGSSSGGGYSSGGSNISYREEVKPDSSNNIFEDIINKDNNTTTDTPGSTTDNEIQKEEVVPDNKVDIPTYEDTPKEEVTPDNKVDIPTYEDTQKEEVTPDNKVDIPTYEDTPKEEVIPDNKVDIPTYEDTPTDNGSSDNYYSPSDNDGYTGGGYSDSYTGGYMGDTTSAENAALEHMVPEEMKPELDTSLEDTGDSLAGLVGRNDYVNIPTAQTPIMTETPTAPNKSSIPVIAGLSAAAIGGIGTKAFKENSKNKDTDEVESEEWDGETELDMNYDQVSIEDKDYLDPTDEYAYQEGDEIVESYQAVNSNELESMQ